MVQDGAIVRIADQ